MSTSTLEAQLPALQEARLPGYDVWRVREDFPLLHETMHGKPLVYLDNANTTQKPQVVIDALRDYYTFSNANIHRGTYQLSEQATKLYEDGREKVRRFLNAKDAREIVFVRNATEGINLVAQTYGRKNFRAGDEIILSAMEHHANIVSWQLVADQVGAKIRVIPINDDGELLLDEYEKLFSSRTRFVSIVHMSNALGTVNPIKSIIDTAHAHGVPVLIDAAQSAYHQKIDVQELDCDFLVFSGHKLYGPTGIGVLYGKRALLEAMPPYQGGGDMIRTVSFEKTTYNDLPYKFEAGTPHIAGGAGLGVAIDYLQGLGLDNVAAHERDLLVYATQALSEVPELRIIGTARQKASVISFVMGDVHPHDIGTILDQEGVAIRTGHHCAQPVMKRFGVPATARVSLGCYNTHEEIDALVGALAKVSEVFA
jgi:cysteine desulfurase/selenocysteine lyase